MARRKGFFRWIIDKFKKLFGIKTKEEKEAELASDEVSDHSQEMRDAGILTAPSDEEAAERTHETRKSGSSPMVTVPVRSERRETEAEELDSEMEADGSERVK